MTVHPVGLSSGANFLRDAACNLLGQHYGAASIEIGQPLARNLNWTPAAKFTNKGIHYFVEPSEEDCYPQILRLRYADLVNFPEPIAVFCVCPEEVYLAPAQQAEIGRLQDHGFGLIAVRQNATASLKSHPIPVIQVIGRGEFAENVRGLPKRIKQELTEAFELYRIKPHQGVASVSEILEGLVQQAGRDAVQKQLVTKRDLGGSVAKALDTLYDVKGLESSRPAVGGVRNFMNAYRNAAHHWPRNKKESYRKYRECKHGFLEGLKNVVRFRQAMKDVGFTGNLARP